jgi:site-specific recombinase
MSMKAASIHEVKRELSTLEPSRILDLCLRLGKYKKENKELLTYLLFEADDEQAYIRNLKEQIDEQFKELNMDNLYYTKKGLRKMLRITNKFIRYSGQKETETEVLLYFCFKIKKAKIRIDQSAALMNLYQGQLKKINKTLLNLHEDLQYGYQQELEKLSEL